ncbi:methylase involved in ubiquinone/menaquinone biosynthesis [Desulfosporosinus acidiphilus SJ4]|uniref:Methylase involved in ubiquinone/menaquinone biosynthesis n=1 Tax=Desulfosporosinus acidiphilus (strain DSM 22704 / JCM 16185 / SJ4) TaxID=646529 RepID=I4D6P8_DESAJ|nr:class I SAM-dependent methyltransferase [Desulfosporosinus acidiphilus]AFM41472.1 methylase involved in ubiquinone/menaquinone biosynthesis [Desulfosporosinus acidiphilus SJ4]
MGELEKHVRIFNLIAPVYNRFFRWQVKNYGSILDKYTDFLKIPAGGKVLDIGCGTGAFTYCLAERGYQAVGVDFSSSMLRAARKSTLGESIEFKQGDVTKGLDFPDASFDLVLSSYVLHGLSSKLRQSIYAEANRLSRGQVLFYDYNQKRRLFTDIVEWAEGGDYFGFVRQGEKEIRSNFHDVRIIDVGPQTAIYLCSPRR